jgi:hypothetical protein
MAQEVIRVGPGICSSQWTVERTIGNLGQEIRQPSNPFANLAQRGVLRSQINALKAMVPDFQPPDNLLPRGSIDIGDSYALLRAMDNVPRLVLGSEARAIKSFLQDSGVQNQNDDKLIYMTKWAWLRLLNGQIAQSAWKECSKPLEKVCMA